MAGSISDILGPRLTYHDLGLWFLFNNPKSDPSQRCNTMSIYLTNHRGQSAAKAFLPFAGKLTPPVDANWKAKRILTQFADRDPSEDTDTILFTLAHHDVAFGFEPITTFLESLSISRSLPTSPAKGP